MKYTATKIPNNLFGI